jgi:IS5 family transposase
VRAVAAADWYERYGRRIEDSRLPHKAEERERYAEAVGRDGFALLDRLGAPDAPVELRELPQARVLRSVWDRHFERVGGPGVEAEGLEVRLRPEGGLPDSTEAIESPYDTDARYRSARRGLHWTGYMAHLTETCDEGHPSLITHAETTTAAVHEVNRTAPIQKALVDAGRPPGEHLVDAGYVSAELLVSSRDDHAIRLVGPPRKDASWQHRTEGAYDAEWFAIDWERKEARCPEGRVSATWKEYPEAGRGPHISVWFRASDCKACPVRELCTRSAKQGRNLKLPTQPLHAALKEMRAFVGGEEGRRLYGRRAGIEGTISQGVRSFGLRRARYRKLSKAHLQHVATASAINLSRLSDWLGDTPRAATRMSQFARLAG